MRASRKTSATTNARLAALLASGSLAACLLAPASVGSATDAGTSASASANASDYGKSVVMDVVLPPAQLARFAAHPPSKPDPSESTLVNAMLADTVDWTGEPLAVTPKDSPYTMVVTLVGTARADGDVATMWQAGWRLDDGSTRSTPFPGLSRNGVKAGDRIVIEKPSAPTSFKADRTLAPVLSFVRASNVDIESVRVQVWSGMGRTTPLQWLMAWRYLLVGVVMLAIAMIWMRR